MVESIKLSSGTCRQGNPCLRGKCTISTAIHSRAASAIQLCLKPVSPPKPIKTWSHHEVCTWVASKQAKGIFKRCGHLSVVSVVRGGAVHTIFIPNCAKRSFHWKDGEPPPSRLWELEALKDWLRDDIISCPANCVDYLSERKMRFNRIGSRSLQLGKHFAVPFQWFAKLSGRRRS